MKPAHPMRSVIAKRLGAAIRMSRDDAGISGAVLSERLDINRDTLLEWERGRACPPVYRLVQIAQALRVPLDHLTCSLDDPLSRTED